MLQMVTSLAELLLSLWTSRTTVQACKQLTETCWLTSALYCTLSVSSLGMHTTNLGVVFVDRYDFCHLLAMMFPFLEAKKNTQGLDSWHW